MAKAKEHRGYNLSRAAIQRLEWLATKTRRTKSSVIELLILNANAEDLGVPHDESAKDGSAVDG